MNRAPTFELTLSRHVRAPREKVFEAFVNPEAMKRWMCPRGMTLPVMEVDARVGGGFRLTMRARDGDQFSAVAKYREIAPPARLVYTWQWEGGPMPAVETLITVTLLERDGGTEIRMDHSGFPDAAMCESHKEGWGSCLNRLVDAWDPRGTAASVALLGDARSSYTRTARLALAEKGVAYTMEQCGPHTDRIRELHPFGRIPAFEHDGFSLYETGAIIRYVDDVFSGLPLQPADARARARMSQAISILDSYIYRTLVWDVFVERIEAPARGRASNEATISAALPKAEICLRALTDLAADQPWLAGGELTLADLHAAPMFACFMQTPEADRLMAAHERLRRWWARMSARESMKRTQPASTRPARKLS